MCKILYIYLLNIVVFLFLFLHFSSFTRKDILFNLIDSFQVLWFYYWFGYCSYDQYFFLLPFLQWTEFGDLCNHKFINDNLSLSNTYYIHYTKTHISKQKTKNEIIRIATRSYIFIQTHKKCFGSVIYNQEIKILIAFNWTANQFIND